MKAAGKKAKGSRFESKLVKLFQSIGWHARKQPLSGALIDFPHDLKVGHPDFGDYIVEAKKWKFGWRTGDKAMGQADMLIIERNFGEPCVYMPFRVFAQMVGGVDETPKSTTNIATKALNDKGKLGSTKIQSPGFRTDIRRKVSGKVEART